MNSPDFPLDTRSIPANPMHPAPARHGLFAQLSPGITKMIRMDHSHVLLLAHRYQADVSPDRKRAIARAVWSALELHAQMEEEIFYPALAQCDGHNDVLEKSKPEHDEMRRIIALLKDTEPTDEAHDRYFMQLMRDVLHHVADEETVLLPTAEKLLADRLGELGARMTKRRIELVAPRLGDLLVDNMRAMPAASIASAVALVGAGFLLARAMSSRR